MKKLYLILTFSLILASCGENTVNPLPDEPNNIDDVSEDDEVDPNHYNRIEINEVESEVANSQLKFACDFYKEYAAYTDKENFAISPLSAYVDLSMVANGVAGKTESELLSVLIGENNTIDDVNQLNRRLKSELSSVDKTTELILSNSIWYNNGIDLMPSFINLNKEYYDAQSTKLDFSDLKSFDILDKWLSDATHGLIKKFQIDQRNDLQFIIANALYFNGKWASPFSPDDTKDADFVNGDGTKSTVKMMHGKKYEYYKASEADGKFVIVKIPYGNLAYSFCVAFSIDDNDTSLKGVEELFYPRNIIGLTKGLYQGRGYIEIPRFEVSSDGYINDVMKRLGLEDLFGSNPDLSNMSEYPVGGLSIVQESKLTVEETGTEGAASTYTFGYTTTLPGTKPSDPVSFTVDRPFVFFVMENSVGSILFIGNINKL